MIEGENRMRIRKWRRLFRVISVLMTHLPNLCVTAFWHLFTLVPVSAKRSRSNAAANEKVFARMEEAGSFTAGSFIENQAEWDELRFGSRSMSYSGCEIIAVYNALLSLGGKMDKQAMISLICDFERKGAAFHGAAGCSPRSIWRYLSVRGYRVEKTAHMSGKKLDAIEKSSGTIILTAYNNKYDIRDMIHTISVTKDDRGYYILHNDYKRDRQGRYIAYDRKDGSGPITTLQEAVRCMAGNHAEPLFVIGVSRPDTNVRL